MTEWIQDAHGNKCSIEHFGSIEEAHAALDSLEDCENCTDCKDCKDCKDSDGQRLLAHAIVQNFAQGPARP